MLQGGPLVAFVVIVSQSFFRPNRLLVVFIFTSRLLLQQYLTPRLARIELSVLVGVSQRRRAHFIFAQAALALYARHLEFRAAGEIADQVLRT